ncbi:cAMP-dependent protein kinase regulatory subunit-like [Lytechinus variegatus]|uniref:cAMP-dependent protein kinase regulatory subunit-like n=1 Tax=Lytechinus variegatus TaxID=7654 RepID=UPI001BB1C718|nr:cAMP-dependent protein kinase regulatory subunit-like [Lytechinus variegatus]
MDDDPFQEEDELDDLAAEDIMMIMNPELKRRRGGATTKTLEEASAIIQAHVEKVSPEGMLGDAKKDAENQEEVYRTPLQRFRAIANTVKHNLKWSKLLSSEEDSKSFTVRQSDGTEENTLTFDVNAFKSNVQSMSTLPPRAKNIMIKNSWERTKDELQYLFGFVDRLKCFDRYSTTIRHELAAVIYYDSFEAGRVIVRQGHPGLAFYFILSGSVIVEVSETDKRTGETNTRQMGETYAGASFGELALLHGTKRGASIRCKVDSEFLRLDKPDFDMVLRRSYQQEWDNRFKALSSLSTFSEWTDDELIATNDRAKVIEYPSNAVIVSDLQDAPDDVYFIMSGDVKIVREVVLLQNKLPFGRVKLTPPPLDANHGVSPDFKLEKYQKLVRKLLHIATIGKGDFFGVGEDLRKTHLIAAHKTEVMLVSRVAFMRHDRGKCLLPMKQEVEELFPTYDETFAGYLVDKRWRAYKRNLVKEVASRRQFPNKTTIEDVPLILRRENSLSTK